MRNAFLNWRRYIFVLLGSGIVFAALVFLLITSVAQSVEQISAKGRAQSYLDILRKTQGFYSSYIVAKVKKRGISIAHDFQSKDAAIPFPATFMHGLVRELSLKEKDLDFRFFSPLPIVERPDSGFADDFEKSAWEAFLANPKNAEYLKFSDHGGMPKLRYALPVRMGENCVGCHNKHPGSPRTDWKVGDLRGVQAVTMPIQGAAIWSQGNMGMAVFALIGGLTILFFAFAIGSWLLMTRNDQLNNANDKIEDLAMRDTLTGQFNRRYFMSALSKRIHQDRNPFTVIVLDLDHFKNVNDVHGHVIGDEVLKQVAWRLSNISVQFKTVARFGGDEFAILADTGRRGGQAESLAKEIIAALAQPYVTERGNIYTGSSVGISFYPDCATTEEDLLSQSDIALIEAKRLGRGQYLIFDEKLREEVRFADKMDGEIRTALETGQFEMYYQPKFDIGSGKTVGLEALLRWNHPENGLLGPGSILPYAEDNGLIPALSGYIAKRVVADLNYWIAEGVPVAPVAINLHRDYICDRENFFDFLNYISANPRLADLLMFEITEDCVIGRGNDDIMTAITAIKDAGVELSLDDFGTGYASLTHLKSLPVDEFKIDREFVRDIASDPQDKAIVQTMIELSTSLEVRVVAEGIETEQQAQMLMAMGCRIGQGFLFSKPVDRASIAHLLRSESNIPLKKVQLDGSNPTVPVKMPMSPEACEPSKPAAVGGSETYRPASGGGDALPVIDDGILGAAGCQGSPGREAALGAITRFRQYAPRTLLRLAELACDASGSDFASAAGELASLSQTVGAKRLEVACDALAAEARIGDKENLTVRLAKLNSRLVEVLDFIDTQSVHVNQAPATAHTG